METVGNALEAESYSKASSAAFICLFLISITSLMYRAGDGDRTRDVQGRKSLSITPNSPLCTPRVQYGSRDDAILGSFWRHAVLSLND